MPDSKNKKDHRSVFGMRTSANGEVIGMIAVGLCLQSRQVGNAGGYNKLAVGHLLHSIWSLQLQQIAASGANLSRLRGKLRLGRGPISQIAEKSKCSVVSGVRRDVKSSRSVLIRFGSGTA